MATVFIDESIHDRADFILIALVYADDTIQGVVERALSECGYRPGVDEFKSSMKMAGNRQGQQLRDHLRHELMRGCKLAVAVCARSERRRIAELSMQLIRQISHRHGTLPDRVCFDAGISLKDVQPLPGVSIEANCDSKAMGGIQIADCAAFIASTLLLAELGFNNKTIPPGDYPSDEPIELAWSLWTALRYSLAGSEPAGEIDEIGFCPERRPFGLLISDGCSEKMRAAAEKRLGTVWIGCVH